LQNSLILNFILHFEADTNSQEKTLIPKALIFIVTADIGVNMGRFSYHFIGSISAPYQHHFSFGFKYSPF
jgi:hypothetical protein